MQTLLFNNVIEMPAKKKEIDSSLEKYIEDYSLDVLSQTKRKELLGDVDDQFKQIFFKGNERLLDRKIISVVGTRKASPKGLANAEKVTRKLVDMGFVVMSGLALGIDSIAHKTTLKCKGDTIAVLGTPIHKIYPKENLDLAKEIEEKGLLISPSLPSETHGKWIFPRRNRLMAKLSLATIIIEASESSGVLHQAAESQRLGKKLLILNSLKEDGISWVDSFVRNGAILVKGVKDLSTILNEDK